MRLQKDNDMSMRKAPLLKLNGVKEASSFTKETMLDIINEGVKLGMEDTGDQIRTCRRSLIEEKGILDLRPMRIGSHCDEKISSSKIPVDSQGILAELLHESSATREG